MFTIDFKFGQPPQPDDFVIALLGEHQMLADRDFGEKSESWGPIARFSRLQAMIDLANRELIYLGYRTFHDEERAVWALVLTNADAESLVDTSFGDEENQQLKYREPGSLPVRPAFPKEQRVKDPRLSFRGLRSIMQHVDHELASAVFRAMHITRWQTAFKFCSSCGSPLEDSQMEMARVCPNCNATRYPVISPAIIVAITRGNELLLCRAKNNSANWHSLVAGYMEAGERSEDTVAREIREEVGLEVRDIRYWGSQPWPFSGSLMLGFRAEYESGEIVVQESEIESASWFPLDALPEIPPPPSIAHRLIVDTRIILTGK